MNDIPPSATIAIAATTDEGISDICNAEPNTIEHPPNHDDSHGGIIATADDDTLSSESGCSNEEMLLFKLQQRFLRSTASGSGVEGCGDESEDEEEEKVPEGISSGNSTATTVTVMNHGAMGVNEMNANAVNDVNDNNNNNNKQELQDSVVPILLKNIPKNVSETFECCSNSVGSTPSNEISSTGDNCDVGSTSSDTSRPIIQINHYCKKTNYNNNNCNNNNGSTSNNKDSIANAKTYRKIFLLRVAIGTGICLIVLMAILIPTVFMNNTRHSSGDTTTLDDDSMNFGLDGKVNPTRNSTQEGDQPKPMIQATTPPTPAPSAGQVVVVASTEAPTVSDKFVIKLAPYAPAVMNVLRTHGGSVAATTFASDTTTSVDIDSIEYLAYEWMVADHSASQDGGGDGTGGESYMDQLLSSFTSSTRKIEITDRVTITKIIQRYTLTVLELYLLATKMMEGYDPSVSSSVTDVVDGDGNRNRMLRGSSPRAVTETTTTSGEVIVPARATSILQIANAYVDECYWSGITCPNITIGDSTNTTDSSGTTTSTNTTTTVMSPHVGKIVWAGLGLSGTIPSIISNLQKLTYLDFGENMLSGPLPDVVFSGEMMKLEHIYLQSNDFTGMIPTSVGLLENLSTLFLYSNRLSGPIPSEIGTKLDSNKTRALRYLAVFNNSLTGSLPTELYVPRLFYLDVGHNQLTGTIPEEWMSGQSSLRAVRNFYLDHNQLTGTLPSLFPQLGSGRVTDVRLNDNANLTGSYSFDTNYESRNLLNAIEIQNTNIRGIAEEICKMSILEEGEMILLSTDCGACGCQTLCSGCNNR